MGAKLVGRIYLRREKDIVHILTVKADAKRGDLYFSMPVSDEQKALGIDNVKSSYHADGQTHLTTQIPALTAYDDALKRRITPGMGFKGDKAYAVSKKNKPLSEIDNVTRIGQGASFRDINAIEHPILKIVNFDDVEWGSEIVDTRKYKNLSLNYFVIPSSKMSEAAGHTADEYYSFKHPGLDLYIVVRIFDYWGEERESAYDAAK